MLLHSEVLGSRQCHIWNQQSLHGGVLGGVHEGDDAVEGTGLGERVLEEVVVVVGHTHAAEDNLIDLGAQGHHSHNLVEGLVGVCEERNLLSGDEGVRYLQYRWR